MWFTGWFWENHLVHSPSAKWPNCCITGVLWAVWILMGWTGGSVPFSKGRTMGDCRLWYCPLPKYFSVCLRAPEEGAVVIVVKAVRLKSVLSPIPCSATDSLYSLGQVRDPPHSKVFKCLKIQMEAGISLYWTSATWSRAHQSRRGYACILLGRFTLISCCLLGGLSGYRLKLNTKALPTM